MCRLGLLLAQTSRYCNSHPQIRQKPCRPNFRGFLREMSDGRPRQEPFREILRTSRQVRVTDPAALGLLLFPWRDGGAQIRHHPPVTPRRNEKTAGRRIAQRSDCHSLDGGDAFPDVLLAALSLPGFTALESAARRRKRRTPTQAAFCMMIFAGLAD
jgi:hypothetical protein